MTALKEGVIPISEMTEELWAAVREAKVTVRRRKLYPTFEGYLQALPEKTRKHKPNPAASE